MMGYCQSSDKKSIVKQNLILYSIEFDDITPVWVERTFIHAPDVVEN